MPRTVSDALAVRLSQSTLSTCYLLRIAPAGLDAFGMTSLDVDVTYDDGSGPLAYVARHGFDPFDVDTSTGSTVNNSQADTLVDDGGVFYAGMTKEGVLRGDYDDAEFRLYLVDYRHLDAGHALILSGRIGQVTMLDDAKCQIELRSLTDILKQNNMLDSTSITDRAVLGDDHNKLPLLWVSGSVTAVGAEADRTFTTNVTGAASRPAAVDGVPFFSGDGSATTAQLLDTSGNEITGGYSVLTVYVDGVALASGAWSVNGSGLVTFATAPASGAACTWGGTLDITPDGYFARGVVHWDTGNNEGLEREIESYTPASGAVSLAIPAPFAVAVGDTFRIRRGYDGSIAQAQDLGCLLNFRGEPWIPRGNARDLMAPTPQQR